MTDTNNSNDEIRALLADLARMHVASQYELDMLLENTNRVLGSNAILGDVVLEIRENTEELKRNFEQHQRNFEQHQRNFEENQRTTNAALNSLEAILLQLTRRDNGH